jgi:hypothetical protein
MPTTIRRGPGVWCRSCNWNWKGLGDEAPCHHLKALRLKVYGSQLGQHSVPWQHLKCDVSGRSFGKRKSWTSTRCGRCFTYENIGLNTRSHPLQYQWEGLHHVIQRTLVWSHPVGPTYRWRWRNWTTQCCGIGFCGMWPKIWHLQRSEAQQLQASGVIEQHERLDCDEDTMVEICRPTHVAL